MCRYRKSIFLCNHSQFPAEPLSICPEQQGYLAGTVAQPCKVVSTHGCSTIRISRLCQCCHIKQVSLDTTFMNLKGKISELRQHLDEAYGDCIKHVDEAGLEPEKKPSDAKEDPKAKKEGDKEIDPVVAFLKMKRNEKYSHLMMLGGV
ncbi:hypothetical protein GGS21DRAFT_533606 [Xylaria nigripes]|nr:hypothetical protein GGS21DRAFT_533606 [Xylaria nigripes]